MATRTPPGVSEQRLHWAIIAVAAALAVAMVGAAAWALTRPLAPGVLPVGVSAVQGETSQGAIATTASVGIVPTDTYTPPTQTPSSAATTTPTSVGTPARTAGRRIAFHLGNTLYIASEDGKNKSPMHIVGTNYALSPDGRTVAAVEKGKLVVAAVGQHLLASSPSTPGLTAEATTPLWLPDSSAVLFIRTNQQGVARIWRLDRSSGTAEEVGPGAGVAVSPDGRTLASMSSEEASAPTISVSTAGGRQRKFRVPSGDPVAIALGKNRIFVSTISASGSSGLWAFDYDGAKRKAIVGSGVAGDTSVTYGELMVSPDGTKLLFAADGDDGYSRLWTVPVAGGTPKAISGLRDGYAIGWTRDGKGILFIEGNAFQGQTTALWHSDLTGNRRKKLVDGAML